MVVKDRAGLMCVVFFACLPEGMVFARPQIALSVYSLCFTRSSLPTSLLRYYATTRSPLHPYSPDSADLLFVSGTLQNFCSSR